MKKYIDLHCHPFKEYYENPDLIIEQAKNNGIDHLFVVGTDLKNSQETINIANKHKNVHAVIGIHPNDAWSEEIINNLEKMVDENIVAIGEVGLDFHYDNSPDPQMQEKCFRMQIEIAKKNNIPVIVHSRDAHEKTYQIIKEYKTKYPNLNFILHSYSSGPEYVSKYVELGVYFSFSGVVTFKNARSTQEAAKLVPLDLIFCETDAPYLTPAPYRGQKNYPQYVIETTKFIACIKEIEIDLLLEKINQNLKKCFSKVRYE